MTVTTVRAAVLESTGDAAVIRELELIEPREGEVRVRMLASGVCHSDLHVRDGEWERPTPIVMGHEGAGIIEAVGPGVTTPRVGQLVALSWLIPCGVCRSCRRGAVWACPDSPSYRHALLDGTRPFRVPGDGAGAVSGEVSGEARGGAVGGGPVVPAAAAIPVPDETDPAVAAEASGGPGARAGAPDLAEGVRSYCAIGTMAEASVVPAAAAIPVPDETDPAVAALIGCCVTTGVGAVLKTAAVPAGSSVAVIGLGGVGLSCVMGAVIAGASKILAIDRMPAKLDVARSMGATDGLLATDDAAATVEALRDLTDGGPDFVFEAIGRVSTVELAIDSLLLGGTAVLVGMTPLGARAAFDVYPFVDGARRILGSNYGFAEPTIDFPRYAAWANEGRLPVDRLIDRRIGLDDLEDAFAAMRRGEYTRQVIAF